MATSAFSEDDFSCPVCYDIFSDPVVLLCSHTFCRACLLQFWEEKGCRECPLCRKISRNAHPPCNLALKNLCEALVKERSLMTSLGSEILCKLHKEKLKLFCLDDLKPICVVCRDSNTHNTHSCRAADEVAVELKEQIKSKLRPLEDNLRGFEELRRICVETAEHTKLQCEDTEKKIKEEFLKLHKFLQEEEAARIVVLRQENELKSQMLKKKIEDMNREIMYLTATIRSVNKQIEADNITFLQKYKASLKRTQCKLKDTEPIYGALINVPQHLKNLKSSVWEKMKDIVKYAPVTLDPNTAHKNIYVSSDLSSVSLRAVMQTCPDNPERFTYYQFLLGSESFGPGTHYWDVDVGRCEEWALGVCKESAHRGDQFLVSGVWRVWFSSGVYRADSSENRYILLPVKQKQQIIRVHLDWDRGKISFYNPVTKTQLHTFKHKFTERLCPTFSCGSLSHFLRILPLKASMTLNFSDTD
ncbi:zinc-binding protein A33-like [Hoplias malabaricus]|uniref:zinc-binding protein A33-like n=1 Tax=Hoplias malabaricus TaxID=27720 RepID=UPI003461E435